MTEQYFLGFHGELRPGLCYPSAMSEEADARVTVHDMRNQLAIAVAHLESWRDGKLEPTAHRITSVLDALTRLDVLIDQLYAARRGDSPAT
jgi:hypothetical protein